MSQHRRSAWSCFRPRPRGAAPADGCSRRGVTLIELLVTLLILSVLFGVAITVTAHANRDDHDAIVMRGARFRAAVARARREALTTGRNVTAWIVDSSEHTETVGQFSITYMATAFPDGSVLADSLLARVIDLDRLNGSAWRSEGNVSR